MIDVSLEVIAKNIREPFGEASGASSSGEGDGGLGAGAGGRGAGRSMPLAKLVPHVASAASDVLAAPNEEPKPVRRRGWLAFSSSRCLVDVRPVCFTPALLPHFVGA